MTKVPEFVVPMTSAHVRDDVHDARLSSEWISVHRVAANEVNNSLLGVE
jgi:hypothetical protein